MRGVVSRSVHEPATARVGEWVPTAMPSRSGFQLPCQLPCLVGVSPARFDKVGARVTSGKRIICWLWHKMEQSTNSVSVGWFLLVVFCLLLFVFCGFTVSVSSCNSRQAHCSIDGSFLVLLVVVVVVFSCTPWI